MFDLPIEELLKAEPGGKLIQTIVLILIWLNVRSLKQSLLESLAGHDKRISTLEVKQEKTDNRLTVVEQKIGG